MLVSAPFYNHIFPYRSVDTLIIQLYTVVYYFFSGRFSFFPSFNHLIHREYINLIDDDLPEEDSDMQRAIAESLDLNVAEKTYEEATYVCSSISSSHLK